MFKHSNFCILIVDDTPANLKLLAEILSEEEYQIGFAQDGQEALLAAENLLPDLILLDIMMPIFDGYEVCQKLKQNPKTSAIPVIFLTAKQDIDAIAKAFEVGGVDYLTKPFHSVELLMRVQTHLLIAHQNKKLQHQVDELQKLQKDLIQSEKIAAVGKLMAGISHGVNTPLGVIKSFHEIISEQMPIMFDKMFTFYQITTKTEQEDFLKMLEFALNHKKKSINSNRLYKKKIIKELENYDIKTSLAESLILLNLENDFQTFFSLLKHEYSELIFELACMFVEWQYLTENSLLATNRISNLIYCLQQYTENSMRSFKTEISIQKGIEQVLNLLAVDMTKKEIELNVFIEELPNIYAKEEDFLQIWYNLISNAIYAITDKGILSIYAQKKDEKIILKFSDTGKGIGSLSKDKIFEPFFTTNSSEENVGFGLFFVKNTLENYNATICVESYQNPTILVVEIPLN